MAQHLETSSTAYYVQFVTVSVSGLSSYMTSTKSFTTTSSEVAGYVMVAVLPPV